MMTQKRAHFNAKDIAGQRFGKLTAISPTNKRAGSQVVWLCHCDCGKETLVSTGKLQSGHTKSCGCLHWAYEDLTGKTFGRWLVLGLAEKRKSGRLTWTCKCSCGTTREVIGATLREGRSKSCGCLSLELLSGENSRFYKHGRWGTVEYRREGLGRRRALERGNLSFPLDEEVVKKRMQELGNKCLYCGGPFEQTDHLIPLARGGAHCLGNLVPSCGHCNFSKRANYLGSEWWPKNWLPRARQLTFPREVLWPSIEDQGGSLCNCEL